MRAITQAQIKAMKEQRFGVEVEMNNISRKKAAAVAADFFGTGRYRDTAARNGYCTWSAWDAQGREWKFQKDVSIHGEDWQKCELVTPILVYEDIETLQELVRRLRKAGAKSDATRGCGIHVHVDAKGHTHQTLRNLINLMAAHETLITEALQIAGDRLETYCKAVNPKLVERVNKEKPTTMDALADVWYEANRATFGRDHHYNSSRYHMLNLHATFTKGTVEFRLFQFDAPTAERRGGIHAGQLKAYIQLCLALSQRAKAAKYISPKEQQMENKKWAMRTWLIHLEVIGDEFKTMRDVLMKHLTGDASYRTSRCA